MNRFVRTMSLVALAALTACSGAGASSPVTCACPAMLDVVVRYTGSFVAGSSRTPPVAFTGVGQTATVSGTNGNGSGAPAAAGTAAFAGTRTAATLGTPTAGGTFTITSVASGTCTVNVGSANGSAGFQ